MPGQKGSHTAPHVRAEGRKFERARGRRWSSFLFKFHSSTINSIPVTQKHKLNDKIVSLSFVGGWVYDEEDNWDRHHNNTTETHELMVGVLLVLVGLGQVFPCSFYIPISWTHFLQPQFYGHPYFLQFYLGLLGYLPNLRYQPLYLN